MSKMKFNFLSFFQRQIFFQLPTMARKDGQQEMQEQLNQTQEKSRDLQLQINAIEINMRRQSTARQTLDANAGIADGSTDLEPEREKHSDQTSSPVYSDSAAEHYVTSALVSASAPVTHSNTSTTPQGVAGQPGQSVSTARTAPIGSVVGVAKQAPVLQPPSDFDTGASARLNPSPRGRGRHVTYNSGNTRHHRPTHQPPRTRVGRGNSSRQTSRPRVGRGNTHHPNTRHKPKPSKLTTGFRWFCVASFQAQVFQQIFELVEEQVNAGLCCVITLLVLFWCLVCK